jgi:hypothetical protein
MAKTIFYGYKKIDYPDKLKTDLNQTNALRENSLSLWRQLLVEGSIPPNLIPKMIIVVPAHRESDVDSLNQPVNINSPYTIVHLNDYTKTEIEPDSFEHEIVSKKVIEESDDMEVVDDTEKIGRKILISKKIAYAQVPGVHYIERSGRWYEIFADVISEDSEKYEIVSLYELGKYFLEIDKKFSGKRLNELLL